MSRAALVITAEELARRLGVSPKTLRAWLRKEATKGNPIVASHLENERWEFTPEDSDELAQQFRQRHSAVKADGKRIPQPPAEQDGPAPTDLAEEVVRALEVLGSRGAGTADLESLPACPGLYTIWAVDHQALQDLGLEDVVGQTPLTERPLYLGKAEDSLESRIANTHFKTGETGHSTVRRTFAALLDLRSCPRPSRIETPTLKQLQTVTASYGLVPEDEAKLTVWMAAHLVVCAYPSNWPALRQLERAVGAELKPLDQERQALWSDNPWRAHVAARRERLRLHAREAAGLR